MVLISCKACRQSFSDDLDQCPFCGEKTKEGHIVESIWAIIFGILLITYVFPMLEADLRNQERIDQIYND